MNRIAILCSSLCLFLSSVAEAQTDDAAEDPTAVLAARDKLAQAEFEAGREAYNKNDWAEASVRFEKAYELSKKPALLYNIGQSADHLRQNQRALTAFESYLKAVPDSPHRVKVEARIMSLREAVVLQQTELETEEEKAKRREAELEKQLSEEKADNRVVKKAWFWVLIGAVVAGAAVATYFIVTKSGQSYVDGIFDGPVAASVPF